MMHKTENERVRQRERYMERKREWVSVLAYMRERQR